MPVEFVCVIDAAADTAGDSAMPRPNAPYSFEDNA
jgi:hypothetical protein